MANKNKGYSNKMKIFVIFLLFVFLMTTFLSGMTVLFGGGSKTNNNLNELTESQIQQLVQEQKATIDKTNKTDK